MVVIVCLIWHMAKHVEPISYLKNNTAAVIGRVRESCSPMYVTQNGRAVAVVQDIESYEERETALTMLKLLALGDEDVRRGRTMTHQQVIDGVRARIDSHKK